MLASGTPVTCLDPPRTPPCAEQPRRPRRFLRLAARAVTAGSLLALAIGPTLAVMLAAPSAHAGQIQIAPEALTRLRHAKQTNKPRAPVAPPPPPATAVAPQRVAVPWFDGDEHDPARIVTEARRVQSEGVDLTINDVELARATIDCFDTFGYWPAVSFSTSQGGHTLALDLGDLPSDSPALAAGLQKHDALLTIDGYRIDDWSRKDMNKIHARGSIALEIDRAGRRLLLTIHWRTQRSTTAWR